MCCCKVDSIFAGTDVPFTPGHNNSQLRSKSFNAEFKTNLVVAFTGSAVSNSVSAFFQCNLNQFFGNHRTRKRSAEQIFLFINGTCFNNRPYIIGNEFFF